jgi:hypothetical protein
MEFETRDYRRRRVRHDRVNAVRGAVWGVALAAREFRKSPHSPYAGVTAIGPLDAIQRLIRTDIAVAVIRTAIPSAIDYSGISFIDV